MGPGAHVRISGEVHFGMGGVVLCLWCCLCGESPCSVKSVLNNVFLGAFVL